MSRHAHFELMARYNQWMNENVYNAATKLAPEIVVADLKAFFRSIFGTLNHLMVADLLWLRRFTLHPHDFKQLHFIHEIPKPTDLSMLLHPDLATWWPARQKLDQHIINFIGEIDEADFDVVLTYQNMKGQTFNRQFGFLLQHFFNHQTHHRGQITTLLTQQGVDVGVTDLFVLIPEV